MTTYKLSKTSIGLMKECPRCFWLTQHKVWKRPQGIMMSLPNGMDLMLKKHFDKFRKVGKLPPEICNNGCCKDMKLFDDIEKLNEWRNNFKGLRWIDNNGNTLFGAVDDILICKEGLVVLDYKTRGFPLKEDTADFYQDQLDIYTFLLRKNGFMTPEYAFLLFYYPKEVTETGEVIFDTELIKKKVSISNGALLFTEAVNLLNEECPKESCEWCEGR